MSTGKIWPRVWVLGIDYDVEVSLIILPDTVIGRLMLPDKGCFEKEGQKLGVYLGIPDLGGGTNDCPFFVI
jgi:hypothetical protein